MIDQALEILARHGYDATRLELLGEGGQSTCYGTGEIAVLLCNADVSAYTEDLTGHTLPGPDVVPPLNKYAAPWWMSTRAADQGMRTPRILAVGDEPRPYALIEPVRGTLASKHAEVGERAVGWYAQLGQEIRKANDVETIGFGTFTPDEANGFRGRFATWPDYLDRYLELFLVRGPENAKTLDQLLAQDLVDERDLGRVEARVRAARTWPVRPQLTHYDNRLDNVMVDGDRITVLDWGLAFSGIGIAQELIKIFETAPTTIQDSRVAAFLDGYGLTRNEALDAIEAGKLMLVLDGLAMASGWAYRPDRLGGVRGWLSTVQRLSADW
ncbi:phosphotransferase family protein [Tenggerimyces flavus]|uniref:Phosphotransferase family protein n=1 Tax=Tenggerimyces flavus TaxID=1708749 RepID=A0ABV7YCE1_9ACTN|nr:phosphotransferase [Tenggerimyces flavus]MBM7783411.1 hypothetical protein [Tenggerimyces flavus]